MTADHITNAVAAALAATIPEPVPVPVPEASRVTPTINRATRRAIARRGKGCCQFPGCTNNRFTEIHHIIHWACGGDHTLTNLTTLCKTHHRLVHEGGYRIAGNGNTPIFLRTDNTPITVTPTQGDQAVIDRHAIALDIGPHTLSHGCGDHHQLHYTIAVLAERHPHTQVQTTKMTTTSTTDLIQHNQPTPGDNSNGNGNGAFGDRDPADSNSRIGSGNERHTSTGSGAADTTPSPARAGVPAGTPRTRPTDCTRGTETAPGRASGSPT